MTITPSGEPTVLHSEVSQCGCEIIVSITLKIPIFLQPEVVAMPPVCHIQAINAESDVTLASTGANPELENLPLKVEVEPTSNLSIMDESKAVVSENETWIGSDWLTALKQLIWRLLPEEWKILLFERMPHIYQILAIGSALSAKPQ